MVLAAHVNLHDWGAWANFPIYGRYNRGDRRGAGAH